MEPTFEMCLYVLQQVSGGQRVGARFQTSGQLVPLCTNEVGMALITILPIPWHQIFHDVRSSPQGVAAVKLTTIKLLFITWFVWHQWCWLGMRFMNDVVLSIDFLLSGPIPIDVSRLWARGFRSRCWCRYRSWRSVVIRWVVLVVHWSDHGLRSL